MTWQETDFRAGNIPLRKHMKILVKSKFTSAQQWICVLDCPPHSLSSDWKQISWKFTLKR